MQKPTLSDIFIRTIEDAHKLFYAVELGQLPKIEKRLNAQERAALRPGDAFVWEEKAPSTDAFNVSIERFTEGLSWTPSRVRDPFLIYYECPKKQKGRRAQKARSLEDQVVRAGESDKFIKLTYSAYHEVPADASSTDDPSDKPKKPRKWHLNAYFTKLTEGQLRTMDDIPSLRDLVVPDGTFRSARTSKNGKKGDPSKPVGSGVKRTFAPFPSQYSARRLLSAEERPAASHPPVPITSSTSQLSSAPTQSSLSTETIPVPEPSTASDTLSPVSDVPPSRQRSYTLSHALTETSFPGPDSGEPGPSHPFALDLSMPFPTPKGYSGAGAAHASPPPCRISLSPSLSERSHGSWQSHSHSHSPLIAPYHLAGSPAPSCASASSLSGSMMDAVPLLEDGSPYQPAPFPGLADSTPRHRHSTGQCRVDLAPLRSLARNHPYRRCPADDRALRLLGPGAR